MRLVRRPETLNEQLLREAGLAPAQVDEPVPAAEPQREHAEPQREHAEPEPDAVPDALLWEAPTSPFAVTRAARGALLPREDDVLTSVEASGIRGTLVQFVALPDRSLVVEEQEGDEDVSPLADAVEELLVPPYRARATRSGDDPWTIGARTIDVRELPGLPGDSLSLARHDGGETCTVDGEEAPGPLPQLAELAGGADVAVTADRLDGDWWEVRVDPL